MRIALLAVAAFSLATPALAVDQNIWSTSFDVSEFEQLGPFPWGALQVIYGGATFAPAGTLPGGGTQFFQNVTPGVTTFNAFGLGAHTALRLQFDLVFVDSWDSDNGAPGVSPDYLNLLIDGLGSYQLTTWSASGSNEEYGPGVFVSRGSYVGNPSFNDVLVRFDLTFAHTSSDFSFSIWADGAGFQYGSDESWGIDNFRLSAFAVPEPATWGMLIAGFGMVGATLRRRRRTLEA